MADTVQQADIRSLDIDKLVKGFALEEFVFKNYVTVQTTNGDSIRWYQETAADLVELAPQTLETSPGALFHHLEPSFTRNTSYPRKYGAESFIPREDMKASDIDIVARTLLRLTRAVVKKVDTLIWDTITESQSAVNINSVTSTAAWDAGSGQDPAEDILEALEKIQTESYSTEGAVLFVNPHDNKALINWFISDVGANVPAFASNLVQNATMNTVLGLKVVVSNNVTTDYAAVMVPMKAATWKNFENITVAEEEKKGLGTLYRVWENGICILTDPKAVTLISNTKT